MSTIGELPYQPHTNRELGMMLRGEKPLARFTDGFGHFPEVVERYLRLFDRQVEAGRLVKREYVVPDRSGQVLGWHTIIFALPDEEWRIDPMIELWLSEGWSDEKEREEGRLLGYEEWQNDFWVKRFAGK
jgi:hypothetical protein